MVPAKIFCDIKSIGPSIAPTRKSYRTNVFADFIANTRTVTFSFLSNGVFAALGFLLFFERTLSGAGPRLWIRRFGFSTSSSLMPSKSPLFNVSTSVTASCIDLASSKKKAPKLFHVTLRTKCKRIHFCTRRKIFMER